MPNLRIGSDAWFLREAAFSPRGIVDSILRLFEQQRITRRKAVELIQYWYDPLEAKRLGLSGDAPWSELNFYSD